MCLESFPHSPAHGLKICRLCRIPLGNSTCCSGDALALERLQLLTCAHMKRRSDAACMYFSLICAAGNKRDISMCQKDWICLTFSEQKLFLGIKNMLDLKVL